MVIVQFTEFMRDVTDDWRLNQHEEDFEKNNNQESFWRLNRLPGSFIFNLA